MFTASNLIVSSCFVAAGVFGWWFIPVAVAAGLIGDRLGRAGDDE